MVQTRSEHGRHEPASGLCCAGIALAVSGLRINRNPSAHDPGGGPGN